MNAIKIGSIALVAAALTLSGVAVAASEAHEDVQRPPRLRPAVVVPPADRSDPDRIVRGGISAGEYLHAVRSAGSCLQDRLDADAEITDVHVNLPVALSSDGYAASYTVRFATSQHGKGVELGPEDFHMVEAADQRCRAAHIGAVEQQFHAQVRSEHGDRAVTELLLCLGAEPTPAGDHEAARRNVRAAIEGGNGPGLECFAEAPLAGAVLAEGL